MTQDDVLFGYRLQLLRLAVEKGVSEACRVMGVHRSNYYAWKAQVDRSGLEMLRPRERRRTQMPNQLSALTEIRAFCSSRVAFLGPGSGRQVSDVVVAGCRCRRDSCPTRAPL